MNFVTWAYGSGVYTFNVAKFTFEWIGLEVHVEGHVGMSKSDLFSLVLMECVNKKCRPT